jgi:hypothetical protein
MSDGARPKDELEPERWISSGHPVSPDSRYQPVRTFLCVPVPTGEKQRRQQFLSFTYSRVIQ